MEQAERNPEALKESGAKNSVMMSPITLGILMTTAFYVMCYVWSIARGNLFPDTPARQDLLIRYFCSHPLEFATTALFFLGMSVLLVKALRLKKERRSLRADIIEDQDLANQATDVGRAERLERAIRTHAIRRGHSHFTQRIADICAFIQGRKSGQGIEEQLKYLADVAADRLHGSFALVRTITWAVPILGFLGTVIGITLAIANLNLTEDQLSASLDSAVAGLAVAFDTTALALSLSIFLVFGTLAVERVEQQVLDEIEEFTFERICPLFPHASNSSANPLTDAQVRASEQLLSETESLINRQTELWQDALESLRERWTRTLAEQQSAMNDSLKDGFKSTLNDHSTQLAEIRQEILGGYKTVSREVVSSIGDAGKKQQEQLQVFSDQMGEAVNTFASSVGSWQDDLRKASVQSSEQSVQLKEQSEILLKIVSEEENLGRLQERLNDNLQALQAAETFEETLNTLSAAVQLMSKRVMSRAA